MGFGGEMRMSSSSLLPSSSCKQASKQEKVPGSHPYHLVPIRRTSHLTVPPTTRSLKVLMTKHKLTQPILNRSACTATVSAADGRAKRVKRSTSGRVGIVERSIVLLTMKGLRRRRFVAMEFSRDYISLTYCLPVRFVQSGWKADEGDVLKLHGE